MTGERVSPRDVIADAILNSRYAPMRDSAARVAGEVITFLEGSGWRIVPAAETTAVIRALVRQMGRDAPYDDGEALTAANHWMRRFAQSDPA